MCLGMYPDAKDIQYLARDLAAVGRQRPVIIFFHYGLEGPYSNFWKAEEKEALAKAIAGYNILAIFHGHFHVAGHYLWHGHEVFLPGSPRHSSHQFIVVHVTDRTMAVAWWDWDTRKWKDEVVVKNRPAASRPAAEG